MQYLIKRNGYYHYNRRIPEIMKEFDSRKNIRISLKTDSREQAKTRAIILNNHIEDYWKGLINSGETHNVKKYNQAIRMAQHMGFAYMPVHQIALSGKEIKERVLAVEKSPQPYVEAVLGTVAAPALTLDQALEKYWGVTKDRIMKKSENQIRKWKNPRIKAVKNFIALNGNKNVLEINRDDTLALKNWWVERIKEGKNAGSANKDFVHLKDVLTTVSDNMKLNIDIDFLFKRIMFKTPKKKTRLAFSSQQIINILHSPVLNELEKQAKDFLFAEAETGARPSELIGLGIETIFLNTDIPFIRIEEKANRELKTQHSARDIPLVGYALEAFKRNPKGFLLYKDQEDELSTMLNKFLRKHKLLPTPKHTVYSMRHSFQDRILRINTPDRVQADLMGHKFERPDYGDGASLEHKLEYLNKVCLKTMRLN